MKGYSLMLRAYYLTIQDTPNNDIKNSVMYHEPSSVSAGMLDCITLLYVHRIYIRHTMRARTYITVCWLTTYDYILIMVINTEMIVFRLLKQNSSITVHASLIHEKAVKIMSSFSLGVSVPVPTYCHHCWIKGPLELRGSHLLTWIG